jgi:hypothetical protein
MATLTFKDVLAEDVDSVYLSDDFSCEAIYKSGSAIKTITVQYFNEPLDKLGTLYDHVWCSFKDVPYVKKNDSITINGVEFGIVDFTADELQVGMDLFLNKV